MKTVVKILVAFIATLVARHNLNNWLENGEATFMGFISILIVVALLVFGILFLLRTFNVLNKTTYANCIMLVTSVLVILLACEVSLRFFSKELQSYGERNGAHKYSTAYQTYLEKCDSCNGGYFFIGPPKGHEDINRKEFHYDHLYNSLGLRDREFTVQKDSNEYRIIGIGDSFTEGVGTSADSTWLKQLEYRLNIEQKEKHYTTLNCGAHGSDLIFGYDLLTKCLLKYHPDLVILNLNSTDVNDIVFRGTTRKYDGNGRSVGQKGPWWEYLFGSSYLVRLVAIKAFHYNWQMLTPVQQENENKKAYKVISQKIKEYQLLAQQQHFKFLLVLQPLQEELPANNRILKNIEVDTTINTVDLTNYLNESFHINGPKESAATCYWPIDGHFTTLGYGVEARGIYEQYFTHNETTGK